MKQFHDSAVSPVIGVLLMLVVTIVIAAVVSGFAGGLAGGSEKGAQMALEGTYSQTRGLEFTHMGGDPLSTLNVKVVIRPSTQFSRYADQWAESIPAINITDRNGQIWVEQVNGFPPGDKAYVNASVITDLQLKHVSSTMDDQHINYPTNIGKSIGLELYDSKTNRLIAKTSMLVKG